MKKRWIALTVALSLLVCSSAYSYHVCATTNYDSEIKQIEEKKKTIQTKNKNLKESIKELEADKSDIMSYIKKLDKKYNEVNQSLDKLQKDIKKTEDKLANAEKELKTAKEKESSQYETMKKRIKYMYENGSSEYVDIIFSAEDIGDLLNRTEYIEKISDYDHKMLKRYQSTRKKIEEKEKSIQLKYDELTATKEEVKAEKEAVKKLSANKETELKKYESTLKVTRAQKLAYEREVAKQEAAVENLLLKKQKEVEAARKAAEAAKKKEQTTDSNDENANDPNDTTPTDSYADATGQYRWPLGIKGRISSYFGARSAPTAGASTYHKGIDIAVASGTPILASNTGTVVTATYSTSAGNYIMIYHGNSTYTVYMHCSKLAVAAGASVIKGQVIGYVGSTGVSTGAHLHFGFSVNGAYVNPLRYVKQ